MAELAVGAIRDGLAISRVFERHSIPHALGGAIAYGVWALPRTTMDVDLNVFVAPDDLSPALDALVEAGVQIDREEALRGARDGGQFIGWRGPVRIDVFTPSIDFSWEAMRTRVLGDVLGERAWVLSAEALSVFKMLFFRTKDIADLERLLSGTKTVVDAPYVRRWLVDMMGEEDPRVLKWDELVREFGGR